MSMPRAFSRKGFIRHFDSAARQWHDLAMPETTELTEEHINKAREFARYLLLHVGPLIDEMQLTRNGQK